MDDRTKEILKLFCDSWIETEKSYDLLINNQHGFENLIPIRQFIAKLKHNGEDKFFRIGTSMYTLIISRSVNHGLRIDQKCIRIEAYSASRFEITLRDDKIYRQYMVDSLDDIKLTKLLNTLKETLID